MPTFIKGQLVLVSTPVYNLARDIAYAVVEVLTDGSVEVCRAGHHNGAIVRVPSAHLWLSAIKGEVVNVCGCGKFYTAESWRALPFHSRSPMHDEEDKLDLELRLCLCGSTRGVEVLKAEG